MTWTRIGTGLTVAAAASTLLATSAIWLLFSHPATVAEALDQGSIGPVVRTLAAALVDVVRGLLAYL